MPQPANGAVLAAVCQPQGARVIVADEDPLVRRIVRGALRDAAMTVVADAPTSRDAIELTLHYRPDVLIVDTAMRAGLDTIRRIRDRLGDRVVILVFTSVADDDTALATLKAGADGFLSKDLDPAALPRVVQAAARGEAAISRRLTLRLVQEVRTAAHAGVSLRPVKSPLTSREWEVLELVERGCSTDEIADRLVVSSETARSHVKSILRKLGVGTRADAAALLPTLRRGEIPLGQTAELNRDPRSRPIRRDTHVEQARRLRPSVVRSPERTATKPLPKRA